MITVPRGYHGSDNFVTFIYDSFDFSVQRRDSFYRIIASVKRTTTMNEEEGEGAEEEEEEEKEETSQHLNRYCNGS